MYKNWEKKLTKHKFLEAEFRTGKDTDDSSEIDCRFHWTTQSDHAGMRFVFTLFRWIDIHVSLYDHRHWNEITNTWHTDCSWADQVKKMQQS